MLHHTHNLQRSQSVGGLSVPGKPDCEEFEPSKRAAGFDCPNQMYIVAELPAPRNFENFHIYLHTFTFHLLGYNTVDEYNALVISDL